MRAIDADKIKQRLQENHDFYVNAYGGYKNLPVKEKARVDEITSCIFDVVNAPTLDVAPVRHAYWVPCNVYCNHAQEFKCSGKDGCGMSTYYDHYTRYCDYDYCPHCGAKMDAGQEDDKNA